MKKPRRGAGGNGEIMKYEEIMAAIKDINGPWSNAACMGYCRMAMKSVGVDEKTQNDVLRELHFCMDTVSVDPARHDRPGMVDCPQEWNATKSSISPNG